MRRYHTSPSIPFHIARVNGVQKPARRSVSGLNTSGATSIAPDHQKPSTGSKTALRVFLACLWVAGVSVGAGVALELNAMLYQGLFAQAFGFFVAGVAIIRHPGE